MTERVVLAYSGGLDTSVGIGWLKDATGKDVVALAIDVGQAGEDMEKVRQRALDCGAVESVVIDAREEFASDYIVPALKANALYQKRYPLVSALSRPLIAKHLAITAKALGADLSSAFEAPLLIYPFPLFQSLFPRFQSYGCQGYSFR